MLPHAPQETTLFLSHRMISVALMPIMDKEHVLKGNPALSVIKHNKSLG